MDCFKIVLKNIGIFAAGMVTVITVTCALGAAGIATAWVFSLPEWAAFTAFVIYSIIAVGTLVGVMECKSL